MDAADVAEVAAWVSRRGFSRVALQFPDSHLESAVATAAALQAACAGASVYLLADTTFGRRGVRACAVSRRAPPGLTPLPVRVSLVRSCCVDEVAASHVDACCVVHFGRSCLSPVSRTPALLVFPRQPLDLSHCAAALAQVRAPRRGCAPAVR